jgi:acyl carrier protein
MPTIEERVMSAIADQMGLDAASLTLDQSWTEDLGADSLETVELIMRFEDDFNLEIPDEQAEKIKTIRNVVDYIKAHADIKEEAGE